MSGVPQPTKCRVRRCTIKGVDLVRHVNQIRVYESVCKPYITATLVVYDTNNVLNNMELVGGEEVSFAFDGGTKVYEARLHLLSIKGEASNKSKRTQIYTIECIGPEYFKDRVNTVQRAFRSLTATDAARKLITEFLGAASVNIPVPSVGMLAEKNSHIISSLKPFAAINDLRRTMNFGRYKTGSTLFFRNAKGHHLVPLEHLMTTLRPTQTFYEEATWGKDWLRDTVRAQWAIIAARAEVNGEGAENGRSGLQALSSAVRQEKKVFDVHRLKRVLDLANQKIPVGKVVGKAIADFAINVLTPRPGGHGGEPNFLIMDSDRRPVTADPSNKTEHERLYQATAANGPRYTIKVPIQSGVLVTAGEGIEARLLPPVGDVNAGRHQAGGLMLVVDLMHEVHLDDKQMTGTTTMHCIRGGLNQ